MAPLTLFRDAGNMATFAADFFPPDFSQWQQYLGEMLVTLQIAVWGTALSIVLSIPLGLMSAENLVPWWIYQPTRRLMDACRAINEMVFAMLFVVAVGLGPFAGVLALFIHTTGVLAKLFSEAVEAIEPGPIEGVKPPVPTSWKKLFTAYCHRSCRCGSLIHSTDLNLTSAPPPWWEWWVPAASASRCGKRSADFNFSKPAR